MSRLEEFDDVQLDVEFTQADTRSNLTSNENIAISFGKISKWYEALVPTGGSSGQFLAWNSSGTAKWVANPNVDTKVTSTLLAQSTAAATYLPTFVSAAGNSGVNIMNSFSFRHTVGTTSAVGNSRIVLGNATASGTANNEEGQIILYSSGTSYHTIKGSATASTVTHSLPTTGGTILNTGTTSFTQTLTSGTKIGSIKINGTSQDIYAPTNTNTTYTLTQDATNGHKITLTPSSGTAQTVTIPDNNTTYTLSGAYGSSSNTWVTTLTPSSGTATTSTVPTASTSVYGIIKLSSSTNSTSTALAATPSAVKSAYDLANGKSTVSFSASLTTGTKIGTITINGTGTDIYCETNTNTDTKVTDTVGTANTYYPAGGTSTSTATGTQVFDTSLKFIGTTGTTSAVGKAQLVLGNSTASGTANNKQGSIVVYGSTAYAHTIQGAPTAARTLTLPNKTGTVAVTSDIPTVNDATLTLKGAGTTVTTFTANASSAKSLDIVAGSNVTVTADATNAKISIASSHPTITKSTDTTSTASPAHGGTFTTVDSVTRDGNGHVTKINTKTVTLPADSNTDTKVTQSQTTTTDYRPILFGAKNSTDASTLADTITDEAYTSTKMYAQPSTGLIFCTGRKINAVEIQTGSTKAAHITLQTLMTWLITTKTYIPSGQFCHVIISTTWTYANNDILQVNIDGVNYEIQLAGVIIEFIGSATSYNAGMFRLLIHSSPTISFTATSGYSKFPVSTIAEYTCNGSDYLPTWKKIWNSHPTYTSKSSGLYKITVDGTGHVSAATAVAKADITALGIPGSDTNTTYALGTSGNNVTLTPSSGSVQSITVPYASNAAASNSLKITGYGISNLTFYQANDDFGGTEGRKGNNDDNYWSHYIIANHGNGETYYHYTIRLPFWGSPQYQRKAGGSDATTGRTKWLDFITEENYTTFAYSSTASRTANTVLAAPNGSDGAATFRKLVAADLPSHTHNYAGSTSAGGAANSSNVLNSNTRMDYGWNGVNYFNIFATAGNAAKVNDTPTTGWWHIMRFNHTNSAGWYTDLAIPFNDISLYYKRITQGSVQDGGWVKVLDALNIGYVMSSSVIKYDPHARRFTSSKTDNAWNAQAYSNTGYADNVYVSFRAGQTTMPAIIGLDTNPSENADYNKIDYCWYIRADGTIKVYESGTFVTISGHTTYASGDEFRVEYSCGEIRYYHNGTMCRSVARAVSEKLFFDSSFYNAGNVYDFSYGTSTHSTHTAQIITSTYKSSTYVTSLTDSVITLSDAASSFGGWICGPTKNGRIAISSYQGSDDKLYFGYGERGRTTNSYVKAMTWDGPTNTLTADKFVGALQGNVTGNCSGSSGSCTGTAANANKLNTDAGTTSIPVYFSGGVPVQCTTPNAYQTNTTTNADYRVLFSTNANDTTQSGTTRKNINLQYNPSTATLKIGDYVSGSTATKNGKLVFGNSLNVYTHTINTNTDKLSNVSLTLNSTDGIMGTDALCYKGYESANLSSDTAPGSLADISSLSNAVSFSGYLARFSYFTVLLCVGTDVTARTTVQVSAIAGYQSYQLIWGGAPNHSGGNLSITSGLVNITESSGTITLNFGKCASYWQFSSSSSTPTKGTTPNIHILKVYGHSIRSNGYH